MNTEDLLLRAIAQEPDDDLPRLAYADWLEESDLPERAELIRVQCRLAELSPDDPDHAGLAARERELLTTHGRACVGPLGPWLESWEFDRGLLVGFRLNGDRLGYAGAVALASTPALARRTTLDLAGRRVANCGAEVLFASPHFAGQSRLDLSRNCLGPQALRALVGSPRLTRLRELVLADNAAEDSGAAVLAASPLLGRLTLLDVRGNYMTGQGEEALRRAAPQWLNLLLDPPEEDAGHQADVWS